MGLVGESGSGKSVTGFSLLGWSTRRAGSSPGRSCSRAATSPGWQMTRCGGCAARHIAMVFQDPMMTLNPVLRVDTQMMEAVQAHERVSRAEARARARDALGMVGIPSPDERLRAYPHQFSGGMRQRVAIAIALLHRPALVVADEPTTALDVTIQAQILAQMQELCAQFGTALIWITHDLSVIAGLADIVAVMYAGRIVEKGTVDQVLDQPMHPYTAGLIGSVPSRTARGERLPGIPGMTPNVLNLPVGCAFRTRCKRADGQCERDPPEFMQEAAHAHRCFHPLVSEMAWASTRTLAVREGRGEGLPA